MEISFYLELEMTKNNYSNISNKYKIDVQELIIYIIII